jgi:hypothetical protein
MNKKIEQLKNQKWSDKYLCKLALLDHIRECLQKDNYLKATDSPKDSEGYQALDKELMDLKIILELYFSEHQELYQTRLQKFEEKLN